MSPTATDITGVVNVALGALPSILALIRQKHAEEHPNAPPLTNADVFAALAYAVTSSVAKDESWKAAHPIAQPPTNDTGD
jgi:hypothetical protein